MAMEVPLKVLCHFTVTRYWKGTIGQYFILDNIQPHWVKTFLSWFSLEAQALDSSLMTRSVRLMPVVLRELNNCDGKITDGRMWMYRTGIIDLNLDRDVLHAWTPLLVAFQPELVPDSTYTSTSMARGTLQNACDFLAKCESASDKYDKLMDLGRLDHTEHNVRFLSEGARIAVYLVERIEDAGKRWKVLAAFWANMMLYIAPSDRAVAHATRMATGGEFVTIIWALLSHAHVVDKLQHRGGAPGLPILLEEEEDKRAQAGPALI
ncbi:Os01g0143600 [Oryza sativa Japonica Group]|uniref:Os01g0143600 protein n=1 Tax=Oryza sativa subsp. japonica TaxID=39947 RepID=A0A0P0UY34_ORYSJ|nr:Os01g0143600 [Oryza sativa Japonica Group]